MRDFFFVDHQQLVYGSWRKNYRNIIEIQTHVNTGARVASVRPDRTAVQYAVRGINENYKSAACQPEIVSLREEPAVSSAARSSPPTAPAPAPSSPCKDVAAGVPGLELRDSMEGSTISDAGPAP
jgi:hypothetical protein